MNNVITPVLLAGGSGSRLWPLSRKSYPKQFSKLIGDKTLFQQSALRLTSSELVQFTSHITMTNKNFRFIVRQQLQDVGIEPGPIFIEHEGRNTAPAILSSCLYEFQRDKNSILLVTPSDQDITDVKALHKAFSLGLTATNSGNIVTFGITPTRAETGYGYLKLSKFSAGEFMKINQFIEKPDIESAQKFLKSGRYLWNSGIFMFRASVMIKAFEKYEPEMFELVHEAIRTLKPSDDYKWLSQSALGRCKNISIDYAIMERARNVVTIPFSEGWSDLGDWNSVWEKMERNELGVSTSQNAHAFDCENTLLRSESHTLELVGLGLKDIIAIAMPDSVLVAHKEQAQFVKKIVPKLKEKQVIQSEIFPKNNRPWGWFESLVISENFQVKRIFVNPGAALSLQTHQHRSEHWVVVKGKAKVTINDNVRQLSEGQSAFIPAGIMHRMENQGQRPLIIIEVQTGKYFGEDDIIRYDDIYGRN